jgi:hypothetical protein
MGRGYFRQKPPLGAAYAGAYDADPFAAANKSCFCPYFSFPLIAQQVGVQIYREGKAFSI